MAYPGYVAIDCAGLINAQDRSSTKGVAMHAPRVLAATTAAALLATLPLQAVAETTAPPPPATATAPAPATTPAPAPATTAPAPTTPAAPTPAPATLSLNVEPIATGVHVAGELKANNQPVPNASLTIFLDDVQTTMAKTDVNGVFAQDLRIADAQPKQHKISVDVDATTTTAETRAEQTFTSTPAQSALLTATADPTATTSGRTVTVSGTLTLSDGSPLAGERILLGVDNATGDDAGAVIDDDGSYQLTVPMPDVNGTSDVVLTVHYDGGEAAPKTSKDVTIKVSEATETPTPTPTPTETTAAPTQAGPVATPTNTAATAPAEDQAPDPTLPAPPTVATLWPFILTLGLGLAMLATIAVLALRRRRRAQVNHEEDDSLETVSHGDLDLDETTE